MFKPGNSMLALALSLAAPLACADVTKAVPGTSDPWLAGMPDGSTASMGDVAPAQSPVEVTGMAIVAGDVLTFSAKGRVSNCGRPCALQHPDGGPPLFHDTGAENGISDAGAPINALLGVFLGPDRPDRNPPPATLDFDSTVTHDYFILRPLVQQVFFIGDGRTGTGVRQQVVVPEGATRLFLGTMDGCCWYNNVGTFTVNVSTSGSR
jgi:hypothetical protein